MRNKIATAGGAGLIAVVFFFVGHYSCFFGICPEDGNPVGYHLHGLARIDRNKLYLDGCQSVDKLQCTVIINIATGSPGGQPSSDATPCPASNNCINVTGSQLLISSRDANTPHPEETVSALGAIEVVGATRTPSQKNKP